MGGYSYSHVLLKYGLIPPHSKRHTPQTAPPVDLDTTNLQTLQVTTYSFFFFFSLLSLLNTSKVSTAYLLYVSI